MSIKSLNNTNGLLIRDIGWQVKTAGPSPNDNKRIELFLLGCKKAMGGNPCQGCFNQSTWCNNAMWSYDPEDVAQHINDVAEEKGYGKYITIGGGEPTDQIDNLILLCAKLKALGFNIFVYTWRRLDYTFNYKARAFGRHKTMEEKYPISRQKMTLLIHIVDAIIDGQYIEGLRIWDGKSEDSLLRSVGSSNQKIWTTYHNALIGYKIKAVQSIHFNNNKIDYIYVKKGGQIHELRQCFNTKHGRRVRNPRRKTDNLQTCIGFKDYKPLYK